MSPSLVAAVVFLLAAGVAGDLASDTAALLAFIAPFGSASVQWNTSSPTCTWVGVVCGGGRGGAVQRVTEIHLPAVGLRGQMPTGALGNLTALTVLSLRFNALSGAVPADLGDCRELRVMNVEANHLSGEIPAALLALPSLEQLNLAANRLSGKFPPVIAKMANLQVLYLDRNLLTGKLPDVTLPPSLTRFNVSFNNLSGEIPASFRRMPSTSFLGMPLCGQPLPPCATNSSLPPSQSPSPAMSPEQPIVVSGGKKSSRLSGGAIAGIVVGCAVVFLLVAAVLLLACRSFRRRPRSGPGSTDAVAAELALRGKEAMSPQNGYTSRSSHARHPPPPPAGAEPAAMPGGGGRKKLVFFSRVARAYDLEDLLRASAEVLGKGTYGTTYKAVLEVGPVVAVKRLKETSLPEREFRDKVAAIGGVEHPNVVSLQAYFFSKDEKLLVYEFVPMGSLSSLLHGNRGSGRPPLNWDMRARIALAAARGIEYIHATGPKVAHGNIKSSNVLLGRSHDARIADHGLASLVGPAGVSPTRVAGYRAPEVVADSRRLSQKADVYSFGVLLLELLTGKAPTHSVLHDDGVDLPRWARSVVHEEWTAEVFDPELLRNQGAEEEMVELLRLAMDCAAQVPEQRPTMSEVVVRIEEMRGGGSASMDRAGPRGSSASLDESDDRPLKPAKSIRQS